MDYDHEIGFWIQNVPYIWVKGKSKENSTRYYLSHDNNVHYIYSVKFSKLMPAEYFKLKDITVPIFFFYVEINKKCEWIRRYFQVLNPATPFKREDLAKFDLRVNGERIDASKAINPFSKYIEFKSQTKEYDAFGKAMLNIDYTLVPPVAQVEPIVIRAVQWYHLRPAQYLVYKDYLPEINPDIKTIIFDTDILGGWINLSKHYKNDLLKKYFDPLYEKFSIMKREEKDVSELNFYTFYKFLT